MTNLLIDFLIGVRRTMFNVLHPGLFESVPLQRHWPHAEFIHAVTEKIAPQCKMQTSLETACFLYDLAKNGAGEGEIIEIGSFEGNTTCALAAGSKAAKREKVHAIDPQLMEKDAHLKKNLAAVGVSDWVTIHRAFSIDVAASWPKEKKVRLIFIDGDHSYEAVKNDFLAWSPHVCKGGWIVFHDFTPLAYHVCEAIHDFVLENPEFHDFGRFASTMDWISWTFFCRKR